MEMNNTGQASSRLNSWERFVSRYTCLSDPNNPSSGPRRLRVFGTKQVDESLPSPSSFSKLLDEPNVIDQQRITEKITHALSNMCFRDPHVLVQFWSPETVRKHCSLTTLDQPFGLGVFDEAFYLYRLDSEQRMFFVDGGEELCPPGRAYRQKRPEWSLDAGNLLVRGSEHFPTRGYINLPVFEPNSDCCVGVLEIIAFSTHDDYTFEVHQVSRALKWVDLKCPKPFEDYSSFYTQVVDEGKENELAEVFFVLKNICNDHQNIPLAQTWGVCGHNSAVVISGNLVQSCSSFNKQCIGKLCMSTSGLPFYVRELTMWGFHEACRERHLDKSHGVVGRSLSSCGISFCEDVTKLGEDEYPLGSYARVNGITSCFAIYLKSTKRDAEYVMELVLPPHNITEAYLQSLVKTVKLHIENVSSVELGNMSSLLVIGGDPHDWNLESPPSPIRFKTEEEVLKEPGNHQVLVENELIDVDDVPVSEYQHVVHHVEHMEEDHLENELMENAVAGTSPSVIPCLDVRVEDIDSDKGNKGRKICQDTSEKPSKKRKTSEISSSLEEISKHFGMPLEAAAVKLNVSKGRLRLICRDHGIARWPYKNHKSDSLLRSNQTEAVIHTSEGGGPTPVLGTSCEPLGPTNITSVPVPLTEHAKQSSIPQRVLLNGSAQPETPIRVQNTSAANTLKTWTIKATYEGNMIRFPFLLSDGLKKLEEQVAKRFRLSFESLRLKYEDEDGDQILLVCDYDLMELESVSSSRQPDDRIVLRLHVLPLFHESPDAY